MLTENEIRCLIVLRIEALLGSCNGWFNQSICGQISGMLAALDGKLGPVESNAPAVLRRAGIPFHQDDADCFRWDDAWLAANGFVVSGERITHPHLEAMTRVLASSHS